MKSGSRKQASFEVKALAKTPSVLKMYPVAVHCPITVHGPITISLIVKCRARERKRGSVADVGASVMQECVCGPVKCSCDGLAWKSP